MSWLMSCWSSPSVERFFVAGEVSPFISIESVYYDLISPGKSSFESCIMNPLTSLSFSFVNLTARFFFI